MEAFKEAGAADIYVESTFHHETGKETKHYLLSYLPDCIKECDIDYPDEDELFEHADDDSEPDPDRAYDEWKDRQAEGDYYDDRYDDYLDDYEEDYEDDYEEDY